ncbi:hypothetical protein [Bacillus sp. FJAT-27251]|uniref:hypothetical protein n=1 Tax=Bacillus sp. FJAT-27251 TaxID=1684142 RepID=UPI0006A7C4BD|nr:hypothetical protein [Bacillus sp. FJAT-27251]
MSAKVMSSFAAGLIVAASVCGAVYFWGPGKSAPAEAASTPAEEVASAEAAVPTEAEMKELLVASGYMVLTEEEWKTQLASAEQAAKQGAPPKEEKETVVYHTIVNVASGMTSIDVGRALVKGKIIDNAFDFSREVEKRGLSNKLRPGTFELNSKMSMDEVMKIIFK